MSIVPGAKVAVGEGNLPGPGVYSENNQLYASCFGTPVTEKVKAEDGK